MRTIVYDIEILNAIPPKDPRDRIAGITYCDGWRDFAGMGIACIGAYDYHEDRYRVFTAGNLHEFLALVYRSDLVVGFNSIPFDNRVLEADTFGGAAWGARLDDKSYDLLREIWIAAGISPTFGGGSHTGYGLDDMCRANFGHGKTGNGALAPIAWQEGRYGEVIDYCLEDVRLTKMLLDCVLDGSGLIDPKTNRQLILRAPDVPSSRAEAQADKTLRTEEQAERAASAASSLRNAAGVAPQRHPTATELGWPSRAPAAAPAPTATLGPATGASPTGGAA